jgi:hypothetical protein
MDKYTLYTTAEECAEVSQNIMKVLRFGLNTVSPKDGIDNKTKLEEEVGQLKYCLDRMTRELSLNRTIIQNCYDDKMINWNHWKEYHDC